MTRTRARGFSLLELLVAMAVMALFPMLAGWVFKRWQPAGDWRQAGGLFHVDRTPLAVQEQAWQSGAGTRDILVEHCGVPVAQFERWEAAGRVGNVRGVARAATA